MGKKTINNGFVIIFLIVISFVAAWFFLEFTLIAFPLYLVIIWIVCTVKKKAAKSRQIKEDSNKIRNIFSHDILCECLVVDSNIWMNEDYDSFFIALEDSLRKNNEIIKLYGPQFDEICNIKTKYKYGSDKSRRARLAIARIDAFQVANLLTITPITIQSDKNAYADPLILRLLITAAKSNEKICFITDDKELRIRAREVCRLSSSKKNNINIIDIDDILPLCDILA